MNLQINTLDTLFFRDGKPFSLGSETWADGIFPPNPSVLYGALRTYIATKKAVQFESVETELSELMIKRIIFEILDEKQAGGQREKYLSMPADLAECKKDELTQKIEKRRKKYAKIIRLSAVSNRLVSSISSKTSEYVFLPKNEPFVESIPDGLILENDLIRYLRTEATPEFVRKVSDFLITESKIGNGREDTHAVKEGSLYRIGMKRPIHGFSILLSIEQKDNKTISVKDLDGAMVKIGADGKLATFSQSSQTNFEESLKSIKITGDYFKVYLATPAIFDKNGWYPDLGKIGIKASLVGACMGKPKPIGGFNMIGKNGRPSAKPMYKTVPAGSVFFFKKESEIDFALLQGQSLSDVYEKQGYGIAYFGNFNPEQQ